MLRLRALPVLVPVLVAAGTVLRLRAADEFFELDGRLTNCIARARQPRRETQDDAAIVTLGDETGDEIADIVVPVIVGVDPGESFGDLVVTKPRAGVLAIMTGLLGSAVKCAEIEVNIGNRPGIGAAEFDELGLIAARDLVRRRVADRPSQAHDPRRIDDVVAMAVGALELLPAPPQCHVADRHIELVIAVHPRCRCMPGNDEHRIGQRRMP